MRRDLILLYFKNKDTPIRPEELESEFSISNRTLRNEVKVLNEIGIQNGFVIKKKQDQGYFIRVECEERFKSFLEELEDTQSPDVPHVRVNNLIMLLLQSTKFQTLDFLADSLMISRSTVVSDLSEVECVVTDFDLKLERKSHYGIRLTGSEANLRSAFSSLSQRDMALFKKLNFVKFEEKFPEDFIRDILINELEKNNLQLSYFALENILAHIKILSFRLTQKNFILPEQTKENDVSVIENSFLMVANRIYEVISELYEIEFPESEVEYLAAHISGKSSVDVLDESEKVNLKLKLHDCLEKLDQSFLTSFSEDSELLETLTLHMHPLLKRLYFNLTLSNPLIDDVYSRYSDVFMVAINFSKIIQEVWGFELSRDEIGYIAMHFAAYIEREKQKKIKQYKRVLLVHRTGGIFANLMKMKLSSVFTDAEIDVVPYHAFKNVTQEHYDLMVSSFLINEEEQSIPFLQISEMPNEDNLNKIRRELAKYPVKSGRNEKSLLSLFHQELFYIEESGDYLEILREKAKDVVELGYSSPAFPELVFERERICSTIFTDGIAAPHAMKMVAVKESVSVIVLKKPIVYGSNNVQIIFLMNFCKGDLHLHKEICNLILRISEYPQARQKILKAKNFNDFLFEISKISLMSSI